MGKWKKSPEWLIELFNELIPNDPIIERRKMFGYPCCFVKGNLFTGLHEENWIVRLSEEDRTTFLAIPGAGQFEPMQGRIMREYVTIPHSEIHNRDFLKKWLSQSFGFAISLPEKVKKQRKKA